LTVVDTLTIIIGIDTTPLIMKNIAFTKEQREEIIDLALGWYEDWKLNEPEVYPETVEERKNKMIALNNSELIKHLQEWYAKDIWDYIN